MRPTKTSSERRTPKSSGESLASRVVPTTPTSRAPRPSTRQKSIESKQPSGNVGSSSPEQQWAIAQSYDVCADDRWTNPGPDGPPNKWLRTLRDDLFRSSVHRRLYGRLPTAGWSQNRTVGPCRKEGRQVVPGGSSKQPNASWPGGTQRRKNRARSAAQPRWMTPKGN